MLSRRWVPALAAAIIFLAASPARAQEEEKRDPPTQADLEESAELRAEADDLVAQSGDTLSGSIPPPDELYSRLRGEDPDRPVIGQQVGAIEYQGQRLVLYPEPQIIILDGDAAAEQSGTALQAQRILFRSNEGIVEAFEEATVSRAGSQLTADSLFYDQQTQAVATYGASLLSEGGSETRGIDVMYDLDRQSGRLGAGVTTYSPWILHGEDMAKIGQSTYVVDRGHFSTCQLEIPHYKFRSQEIKLRVDDVIVASPVILYFSDVPVFVLPWYVQPAISGRRSGFLRPEIGINTLIIRSSQERNVQNLGYYWAINEYADFQAAMDIFTESRFIVRFDGRYHQRHVYRGDAHYERVWNRLTDSRSQLIRFRHDHTISRTSSANATFNWSDQRSFLQENSFDPTEILQRSFRSAANYSTRFNWGSFVAGSSADFLLDQARTNFTVPDVRLSITQRPLWGTRGAPGSSGTPWYQILQYNASSSFRWRISRAQVDSLGNPISTPPTDSLGNIIDVPTESILDQQEYGGRFSLSGPVQLGPVKTTPAVSYSAAFVDNRLSGQNFGGTGQLNAGISASTQFFRIYDDPIGFQRMRHTVIPNVTLGYTPAPNFFGTQDGDVVPTIQESLILNTTVKNDFDVKIPLARESRRGEEDEDEGSDEGDGEEDEEVQTQTINLLSITNTLPFNITRHRQDGRIGWGDLTTRLTTGLGRNFNINSDFSFDLTDIKDGEDVYSFFLTRLTTDFRMRGGSGGARRAPGELPPNRERVSAGQGSFSSSDEAKLALEEAAAAGAGGAGPWSVSLTHNWTRTRGGSGNRQSLSVGLSVLPSPHWSLNYRTNYDITGSRLGGQTLALVRDLHEWQLTLGFNMFPAEPQNRVLITLAVYLRDVPDLELPWRVRRD